MQLSEPVNFHRQRSEFAPNAFTRVQPCGHPCGEIRNKVQRSTCVYGCQVAISLDLNDHDLCSICLTSNLSAAPAIQLACGHVFHEHCCRGVLESRWPGPRISFSFLLCPLCKRDVDHPSLIQLLEPLRQLREKVQNKALTRLQFEGKVQYRADVSLADYAMEHYAYYICFKCKEPYFGGAADCEQQVNLISQEISPTELVCGSCSNVARAQVCQHGTEYLSYKCRYCCSLAVFFCFGTTHFCTACHDDHARLGQMNPNQLPKCPVGPRAIQLNGHECPLGVEHPATGQEFALGCGMCANSTTF